MLKRVVVLGATGLVGKHAVERLSRKDEIEQVVAVTRRSVDYTSRKVINEVVDFERLDAHREVFGGDALFSCLGTTRKQAGSVAAQRRVDYDYQYAVARMASENGVGHYLLVSSGGADSNAGNAYSRMKGELEEAVAEMEFERISIFQPSLIVGDRDQFRFGETLAKWVLPVLTCLPTLRKYRAITGDAVAKKMVGVTVSSGEPKEVYHLDEIFDS